MEDDRVDQQSDTTPEPKRRKISTETGDDNDKLIREFKLEKVLHQNRRAKSICVQGSYEDSAAVLLLEKTPLNEDSVKLLTNPDTKFELILNNGIYSSAKIYLPQQHNAVTVTTIFPATSKHIEKYSHHSKVYLLESPDDYASITLPYIQSSGFSVEWVYNILEKKAEAERIIYEDADPQSGFILLPDIKWDGTQLENLYLIAMVNDRSLLSIRDLRQEHLTLLQNIRDNGKLAIKKKYDVPEEKLRIYFHYQPSYYHLHVHFTHLDLDCYGQEAGKAHLLDEVIENIRLCGDFYKDSSLGFCVDEESELSKLFRLNRKLAQ